MEFYRFWETAKTPTGLYMFFPPPFLVITALIQKCNFRINPDNLTIWFPPPIGIRQSCILQSGHGRAASPRRGRGAVWAHGRLPPGCRFGFLHFPMTHSLSNKKFLKPDPPLGSTNPKASLDPARRVFLMPQTLRFPVKGTQIPASLRMKIYKDQYFSWK